MVNFQTSASFTSRAFNDSSSIGFVTISLIILKLIYDIKLTEIVHAAIEALISVLLCWVGSQSNNVGVLAPICDKISFQLPYLESSIIAVHYGHWYVHEDNFILPITASLRASQLLLHTFISLLPIIDLNTVINLIKYCTALLLSPN